MFTSTYVRKWVVFEFDWRIKFSKPYLKLCNILRTTDVIHLQYTFPILQVFFLFIKSQLTTESQNILHLNQYMHDGHIRSLTVTTLPIASGRFKLFDRHKKYADEVSAYFQLEMNEFWFISDLTYKNLKDWGQHIVGLYLKNCLWTYINMVLFLGLLRGTPAVCRSF
jgi:hypothetical protein